MTPQIYLAIDLGAGSGRVVAGHFNGKTLQIEEVHRFVNQGICLPTGWHWNITQLFSDIVTGIAAAQKKYGDRIVSLAVDTWGVDYGLLDASGRLLGLPWMYRDSRTDGLIEQVTSLVPREDLYRRTGIQFLFFNTLYQLTAESRAYPGILQEATHLAFMPDLLTYWLSGERIIERTIASTSQLLRAGTAEWDEELAATIGLPGHLLGRITEPGTTVGRLRPELLDGIAQQIKVVACGSHDTASAVAGVPSSEKNPLFLSSGTWSLIGREIDQPIVTADSFAQGFSNEQGLAKTTRFLKNVAGMWLLQECKRNWDAAGYELSYGDLVREAENATLDSLIDPDHEDFVRPCDMPAAIAAYLQRSGQPLPQAPGEFAHVILQSLAVKYRLCMDKLEEWMPDLPDVLHIVGGGCQNHLLNQMTADAIGRKVEAGPVEATAAGNILAQLMAGGEIASVAEGRAMLRESFHPIVFEPREAAAWEEKTNRLKGIISRCP